MKPRLIAMTAAALALACAPAAIPGAAQAQHRIAAGAPAQLINLPRGSSMAIDLPADARDVIVPNPVVAEAMLHSPRRITVIGLQPGETDAVVLDASGRTILSLRVRVDAGVSALQDTLSRVMPGAQVHAEALNDSIILTGSVSSPGEADRANRVARAFVSAPEKVINMMTIAGSDQVTVRARVVEVQRSAIRQLGLSTDAVFNNGTQSWGIGRSNTFGVNGSQLGGGGACYRDNDVRTTTFSNTDTTSTVPPDPLPPVLRTVTSTIAQVFSTATGNNITGCLQAFERAGLVRLLAEPNLTAVNGESAEFLAGGEFPVPVGRSVDATTGQTTIGIEFKPFGVRLGVRPIVLGSGRISLQLSTEVSELTTTGAFTLGGGSGEGDGALVIPALNVRRTSTTVELPSGGSLMVSGLLREDTRQNIDQLPGAGSLPVLGALFRSRDYLSGETELVFIIEAYIVSPTAPGRLQTPADGLVIASDARSILFGQLSQRYGATGAQPSPAGWAGPAGYVIE